MFLTNNSSLTIGEYVTKLSVCGVPAHADDVCTSAQAAALLVNAGEQVLVCGGPGVGEAVEARGAVATHWSNPAAAEAADVVIVGWHQDFDYASLTAAFRAIKAGARFIATNDDATYPTPTGAIPGGGSLVAAVAYASGQAPIVAGKPYEPTSRLVRSRLGLAAEGPLGDSVTMVGDRLSTDGRMAEVLGARFGLVYTGVTKPGDLLGDVKPWRVAADLGALVAGRNDAG